MLLRGLTYERIRDHCAFMAKSDREYAEWAWREYVRMMPWIVA